MTSDRATSPLTTFHKIALIGLGLLIAGFFVMSQFRGGGLMSSRMTDADCYLRGAWAVRSGTDAYEVVDDNGWHYAYPPLFAIALWPLGDPPHSTLTVSTHGQTQEVRFDESTKFLQQMETTAHRWETTSANLDSIKVGDKLKIDYKRSIDMARDITKTADPAVLITQPVRTGDDESQVVGTLSSVNIVDRTGYLPYWASHLIWLFFDFAFVFAAIHVLANALEQTSGDENVRNQPRFCQRWWAIRVWPLIFILPAVGRSLARGQVGPLWLLFLCWCAAAILREKPWRAGVAMAGAVCLKIIPGFLILMPLWRRDPKFLAGGAIACLIGLAVIPGIVMGPTQMVGSYRSLLVDVIGAAATGDTQGNRGKELTGVKSTDSNSPVVIIHNILNPNRDTRPDQALPIVRKAQWVIAAFLTLTTLFVAGFYHLKQPPTVQEKTSAADSPAYDRFKARLDVVFLSALTLVMIIISPVFHPHYFILALMPVMILMWLEWERNGFENVTPRYAVLFWFLFAAHIVSSIGGPLWFFRDFGIVLAGALYLWVILILEMGKLRTEFLERNKTTPIVV